MFVAASNPQAPVQLPYSEKTPSTSKPARKLSRMDSRSRTLLYLRLLVTCAPACCCMLAVDAQWCVGANKDPNFKTWEEITIELGHQHRILDVFKMDIEGHEPGVIAELRHDRPLPRQVVMEIHMHSRQVETGGIAKPAPRTRPQLALLMMHMASLGYGIVGQEDNIWGVAGCCAEWTFLLIEQPWVAPSNRYGRHKRPGGASEAVDAGAGGDLKAQAMGGAAGRKRRLRTPGL